jgi:hypothetical protein
VPPARQPLAENALLPRRNVCQVSFLSGKKINVDLCRKTKVNIAIKPLQEKDDVKHSAYLSMSGGNEFPSATGLKSNSLLTKIATGVDIANKQTSR